MQSNLTKLLCCCTQIKSSSSGLLSLSPKTNQSNYGLPYWLCLAAVHHFIIQCHTSTMMKAADIATVDIMSDLTKRLKKVMTLKKLKEWPNNWAKNVQSSFVLMKGGHFHWPAGGSEDRQDAPTTTKKCSQVLVYYELRKRNKKVNSSKR